MSILIPCYNEEVTIEETIQYLVELDYPLKEIIAVNDGSKDSTFKF
ncbi:glycosyltransferase [Gottfriedia acidiceleris]